MLSLVWFTIGVLMTALFELLIFAIAFLGTDKLIKESEEPRPLIDFLHDKFQFYCWESSKWWIEKTSFSMTLFKLHFIVIFMYQIVITIVLWKIPYKYDRIKKTKEEKDFEKKRKTKSRMKKRQKSRRVDRVPSLDNLAVVNKPMGR